MLRCQVYYEPYFKTSLKCLKEGSELDPIKLDIPLQRILILIFLIIYRFVLLHDNNHMLKTTAETSMRRKQHISVATLLC